MIQSYNISSNDSTGQPQIYSLSSSKWPSNMVIIMHYLLQNLIVDEIVTKRVQQLMALARGLEKYELQLFVHNFPESV